MATRVPAVPSIPGLLPELRDWLHLLRTRVDQIGGVGGAGGITTSIEGVADGDVLVYDSVSGFWLNVDSGTFEAGVDHGSIGGLAGDDHVQYLLTSGGRNWSGHLLPGADSTYNLGATSDVLAQVWTDSLHSDGVIACNVALNMGANALQFSSTQATLTADASAGGSAYDGIELSTADGDSSAPLASVVISAGAAAGDYPYGTIWLKYGGDATIANPFTVDLLPDADSTHDLGASGAVMAEVWTDAIKSDGVITVTATGSFQTATDLLPNADSSLDLGATGAVWAEVWVDKLESDGTVQFGVDLIPDADSTHDIGSTGAVLAEVWADAINSDGNIAMVPTGGAVMVTGEVHCSMPLHTNDIHEYDAGSGVIVDSVLIKDAYIESKYLSGGTLGPGDWHPAGDSNEDLGATGSVWAEVWTDSLQSDGVIACAATLNMGTNPLQFNGAQATLTADASAGGSAYDGIEMDTADADTPAPLACVVISTDAANGDYPFGTIWIQYAA